MNFNMCYTWTCWNCCMLGIFCKPCMFWIFIGTVTRIMPPACVCWGTALLAIIGTTDACCCCCCCWEASDDCTVCGNGCPAGRCKFCICCCVDGLFSEWNTVCWGFGAVRCPCTFWRPDNWLFGWPVIAITWCGVTCALAVLVNIWCCDIICAWEARFAQLELAICLCDAITETGICCATLTPWGRDTTICCAFGAACWDCCAVGKFPAETTVPTWLA